MGSNIVVFCTSTPRPETAEVNCLLRWSSICPVERLPARQRLAVYLRYRADLPFEEMAAILGIQAVSARSHVSRALETLRESFAGERETNQ